MVSLPVWPLRCGNLNSLADFVVGRDGDRQRRSDGLVGIDLDAAIDDGVLVGGDEDEDLRSQVYLAELQDKFLRAAVDDRILVGKDVHEDLRTKP